ncbi:hydroxyaromatic non-oxidative decarboxylase protein C [Klebsiella pneumoniae]|uniref:Hydroxyaromatic non-oxidative decarboxylase protein C n=1 Tax=Klebsiella pneumoniae TaxID=573 RepID=A0A378ABT7_KLEPN|nr:hydroxyaromatic non-oxidative decarboxylase protein C [Klebsiella pneumoniae]
MKSLYLGMPWTEIDYLMGPATCVPLYQQLKAEFPEVQAVNAMYTMVCWRSSPPKNATAVLPARWACGR